MADRLIRTCLSVMLFPAGAARLARLMRLDAIPLSAAPGPDISASLIRQMEQKPPPDARQH